MKMPEPIIEPTTIMVESKRPSPRMKPCSLAIGSVERLPKLPKLQTMCSCFRLRARAANGSGAAGLPPHPRGLIEKLPVRATPDRSTHNQFAHHGQRIGAGAVNVRSALERDASDGHQRLARVPARLRAADPTPPRDRDSPSIVVGKIGPKAM